MGLVSRTAAALVCVAAAASAANATPTTFAQYFQTNGALQQFTIATTNNRTTVTASGSTYFLFSGVSGLPFAGTEQALFTLNATSTQLGSCGVDCGPGDSYVQPGYSGTFSFIDT